MAYVADTKIALPVHEDREVHKGIVVPVPTGDENVKQPGERITLKELKDAGQGDAEIKALVDGGAMHADGGS